MEPREIRHNTGGSTEVDSTPTEAVHWDHALLHDAHSAPMRQVGPSLLGQTNWQSMLPAERMEHLAVIVDYLREQTDFGPRVIDDACYERCEGYISCLITNGLVEESLLGRFFVLNPWNERLLSAEKPLALDGNLLQQWFAAARENLQLVPGSTFSIEGLDYKVDNFSALRCTRNPGIYLDDSPVAYWGIAHVTPTIGSMILDPSHPDGIVSIENWMAGLGAGGLLPFFSTTQGKARLVSELLDAEAMTLMHDALKRSGNLDPQTNELKAHQLQSALYSLPDTERFAIFDSLLDMKIREGGLLPMRRWSRIYPGVLTMRGEVYGEFDAGRRDRNEEVFDGNWTRRLELAKRALQPFATFQKLIEGADYGWSPPENS